MVYFDDIRFFPNAMKTTSSGFSLKKTIISIASTAVLGVGGTYVANPAMIMDYLPDSLRTQVTEIAQKGADAVGGEVMDSLGNLNPDKQLGKVRNAQRSSDLNVLLNAISQFTISNGGSIPKSIPKTPTILCSRTDNCGKMVNLGGLVTKKFLRAMPVDPKETVDGSTGYTVATDGDGQVTLCAPLAEGGGEPLCVTR